MSIGAVKSWQAVGIVRLNNGICQEASFEDA